MNDEEGCVCLEIDQRKVCSLKPDLDGTKVVPRNGSTVRHENFDEEDLLLYGRLMSGFVHWQIIYISGAVQVLRPGSSVV